MAADNAMPTEGEGESHAVAAGDMTSTSTEGTENAERGRQTTLSHWLL